MKVRVSFTLDVDAEQWELAYGVPASEIRDDVRSTVAESVTAHYEEMGMLR